MSANLTPGAARAVVTLRGQLSLNLDLDQGCCACGD
jgi:hypothetical protein